MTQHHITHDFELSPCKAGHRARHIHDLRCLRAGGGHFVECACSHTARHLEFDKALAEWKRLHAKRGRPAKKMLAPVDSVVQFPLQLQGRAR